MSHDKTISAHYTHGKLLGAIQSALAKMGKTIHDVTIKDLAPVGEFHIGGQFATDNLANQLRFSEKDHILDVGCGIGGASRFIADKFNASITGIDLTKEYVDVGNTLCGWVGFDKQITLHQGSALSMPFEDEQFNGAVMLHVGMNIEDKPALFEEIHRVLRPEALLGIYDVMRVKEGDLAYPVPWATENSHSRLAPPEQYRDALNKAGFNVLTENDRTGFALELFKQMRSKTRSGGGPPPLGLHTLMQESAAVKVKNMIENVQAGLIAPVEIISRK